MNFTHKKVSLVERATIYLKKHPDYFANGKSALPLADRILKPRTVAAAKMAFKMESDSSNKNQQMFQEIFTDALLAVEVYSPDGKLINANQSTLNLFGISKLSDIIGFDLFSDLNLTDDVKNTLRTTGRASYEDEFDFDALRKTGVNTSKTGKMQLRVNINKLNNGRVGYVVQVVDITKIANAMDELKGSKLKYMNLVDKAQNPMFSLDADYKFLYVNNACQTLIGAPSSLTRANIIGKSLYEVFSKEEADIRVGIAIEVFKTGESSQSEVNITLNDGKCMYVSVSADPIKDNDGKVISASFMVKDVTERKKLEDELKKTNHKLGEVNVQLSKSLIEKDKFFSMVAHDLKNPFGPLLGFLQMLNDEYSDLSDNERKNFISIALKSSQKAFSLLEQMLEWRNVSGGKLDCPTAYVNVRTSVNNAISPLLAGAEKKQIAIKNQIFYQMVSAQEMLLERVIANLVSNAIKFTPSVGNGVIAINATPTSDGYVQITVSDNGRGISKELVPHLFLEMASTTTPGTDGEIGTGLGLPMVKMMVEKMNGKISVASEEGKGTTFTVILPAGHV